MGCSFQIFAKILTVVAEASCFPNRVLKRIFGMKRDGGTGGWRELHNEELYVSLCPAVELAARAT
jgi:hypothetical protein